MAEQRDEFLGGDDLGYDDIDVDLTPGVGLLGALKGLRYNEWYALAEYVDNSLSSYIRDEDNIASVYRQKVAPQLVVEIKQSPDRLVIRDNAGGISKLDIQRALRTGTAPIDRSQFNLYGIGMKAASIWFGDRFAIKTTCPGEAVGRLIDVDLREVIEGGQAKVKIQLFAAPEDHHYTVIGLSHLRKPLIAGRTLGKVREFLASIYREYINDDVLRLEVMGEEVLYVKPYPLRAKRFDRAGVPSPESREEEWEKPIEVQFALDHGQQATATGWAMVRETGSTANSGFALTQNRRVIEGAVEPWRPQRISGPPNKHRYQRLEGQLDLVGVEPEITKTNFRWSDAEVERFMTALAAALDAEPLPLLRQADNFRHIGRQKKARQPDTEAAAKEAVVATAEAVARAEDDVLRLLDEEPTEPRESAEPTPPGARRYEEVRTVRLGGEPYEVRVQLAEGASPLADWLTVAQVDGDHGAGRKLDIRVNRDSLFMEVFEGATGEAIKPIIRVAAAIAVAETAARAGGADHAPLIRRYVNELLRGELGTD
jgi:hypothetical protein